MCDRCGEPGFGLHGFSVAERPAQRLVGRAWEGPYGVGAPDAIQSLIEDIKAVAAREQGIWRSPIVGLATNRADGFRYFVGFETDADVAGLETVQIPAMRFASLWYVPGEGEVAGRYQDMLAWIDSEGLSRDRTQLDQREEFPPDVDFSQPLSLRIMLPVI